MMQTAPPPYFANSTNFDESHPKHKCCCGCVHVRTGAIIIGILEIFMSLSGFSKSIIAAATYHPKPTPQPIKNNLSMANFQDLFQENSASPSQLSSAVFSLILVAIIVGLLFYGIYSERKGFIIPHLVVQIIGVVVLLIAAVFLLIFLCIGSTALVVADRKDVSSNDISLAVGIIVALMVLLAFYAALEIWWLCVIWRLYKYLKEKEGAGLANVQVMIPVPPSIPVGYNYNYDYNHQQPPPFDHKAYS